MSKIELPLETAIQIALDHHSAGSDTGVEIMTLDEARIAIKPIRGRKARIFTTKGEEILADNVWLDEEHLDVVHNILSTNQPERYVKMAAPYQDSGWVTPLEFITRVDPVTEAAVDSDAQ